MGRKKKKQKTSKPKTERPFDPVIANFSATHGYLDAVEGIQDNRSYVAKMWGKQYIKYYEAGRKDAKHHLG